jgi:precorrin-6A/cobalt-precorrin-6A reductase
MVLILGGTYEARELAAALVSSGEHVVTSLAGRVARPRLPAGEVRIGGFGGPQALAAWLRAHGIHAVVDATHPFAERISASAVTACGAAVVPLLRLERPGWAERAGDRWTWVDDLEAAAGMLDGFGSRAFLTTGRQGLAAFADTPVWCLIRCVDPPAPPLPVQHHVILDRGPYTIAGEEELLDRHRIDVVVTKDSGGDLTVAKLDAARARGMPVVVIRRPAGANTAAVGTVGEAVSWLAHAG